MVVNDPIADMLNRIRNGIMARHESTLVPASKMKIGLAKILKEEGFIKDFEVLKDKPQKMLKIHLRYDDTKASFISGMERVSKPGLRVYVEKTEIPRVQGGAGVAIISTSKGLKTGRQAWRMGVGGELLFFVW